MLSGRGWVVVILTAFFCASFATGPVTGQIIGQIIELEKFVNGRASANFLPSAKNVKFTLEAGTRARVLGTKKFSSGNHGLQVEVATGPRQGETAWVYYATSDPGMRLYESDGATAVPKETREPDRARSAVTTRTHLAYRDPATTPTAARNAPAGPTKVRNARALTRPQAESLVHQIESATSLLKGAGQAPCGDCQASESYARGNDGGLASINPFGIRSQRCQTVFDGINTCFNGEDVSPSLIKITNTGPNATVPKSGDGVFREWGFHFEGYATQDMGLSITDSPSGRVSQTQESFIMLFPRRSVPRALLNGDQIHVTLPTGEQAVYDRSSRRIIGGVLSENGPMTLGRTSTARVSYKGSGVMVRVDSRGRDPRQSAQTAVITKQGRECRVPASKLWSGRSGDAAPHFKFPTDAEFDRFLRSACRFGI